MTAGVLQIDRGHLIDIQNLPDGVKKLNVLDIDLDFFFDSRVDGKDDDPTERPDEEGLIPWPVADVTSFLEDSLNLRMNTPGAIVESHHEVFYEWQRLIKLRELVVPFKLVHVDAHSDLGMGFQSWIYLLSEFLSLDISDRPNAQQGNCGINYGSFLAFAFGCRWISQADFIINHNWRDDIAREVLSQKSFDFVKSQTPANVLPYGDYKLEIELMRIPPWDLMTSNWNIFDVREPVGEPRTPFNIITIENVKNRYSETKWDYVFLSHSPGYVPAYADHLFTHISQYIDGQETASK